MGGMLMPGGGRIMRDSHNLSQIMYLPHVYEGHSINKGNSLKKAKCFLEIFSINQVCLELVRAKIISILTKIFVLKLFKMVENKNSAPGLNKGLLSNFSWPRSANDVNLTEEYMMSTEKCVLVKNMFTNRLNIKEKDNPYNENTLSLH